MTGPVSPQATGGAGTTFEQHVGAAFLAQLFVGGSTPFIRNCELATVHLQGSYRGWKTDDIVLEGVDSQGNRSKVAIQCKRSLSVAESNDDFVDACQKAWADFHNAALFARGRDALALITGCVSERSLKGLRTLLDCARTATDFRDMVARLGIDGYLGNVPRKFFDIIRTIIEHGTGTKVDDWDLFDFLQSLDFIYLDINTPNSHAETLIRAMLAASVGSALEANAIWANLLRIVSTDAQCARSFRREDVEKELGRKMSSPSQVLKAVEVLDEITSVTRQSISTTIGTCTLPRSDVQQQLLHLIESHRIVLVTGEAGIGKSGVCLKTFDIASQNMYGLAVRAEMLVSAHLNSALNALGLSFKSFMGATVLHPRKIVWIESAERLLEKPAGEREAFSDFINIVSQDPSWRIVISCRDYSSNIFESAFLSRTGLACAHLRVPNLTDSELDVMKVALPELRRPLGDQRLKSLLRNLFILNKALLMKWTDDVPLPKDEHGFRAKVWTEIVRKEEEPDGGMPQRRAQTFIEIALKRARELEPFVQCHTMDPDSVQRLKRDTLIVSRLSHDDQIAPAHDVLEDWAMLQWLTREFTEVNGDWAKFLSNIGTQPAVRRAFRKWLVELLASDPKVADSHILKIVRNQTISKHWCDDALVATLLSPDASGFIHRNRNLMFDSGAQLLRRVIHLLRVACKGVSEKRLAFSLETDAPLAPIGTGWHGVADLIAAEIGQFKIVDAPLLIQFAYDWCGSVSPSMPYPLGAASIARIVSTICPVIENFSDHSYRENLAEVAFSILLRIPNCAQTSLEHMVNQAISTDADPEDKILLKHLFTHDKCGAACRDLPKLVVQVAEFTLGLTAIPATPPLQSAHYSYRSRDLEDAFGMPPRLGFGEVPPSAYRGPFYSLLQNHLEIGLDLVIRFLNKACSAYADPANQIEYVEMPEEIEFELPDGTTKKCWGNFRLWGLYRSHSVGPYSMQSALMAVEKWLLEKGGCGDSDLANILNNILERTNNVALVAVVASVATAYPSQAGTAATSVISNPLFFDWDLARFARDLGEDTNVLVAEGLGRQFGTETIYYQERKESSKLPHRRENLEHMSLRLQTVASAREPVWRLLDKFRNALPSQSEQNDDCRLWRLKLHRMDLRNFTLHEQVQNGFIIKSNDPPDDVKQLLERDQPTREKEETRLHAAMWGMRAFQREAHEQFDPANWKEKLDFVRSIPPPVAINDRQDIWSRPDNSHFGFIAAVCVRDHWAEMTIEEKDWCCNTICWLIEMDVTGLGAEPAALVVPLLCTHTSENHRDRAMSAMTVALFHPSATMAVATAHGIGLVLDADIELCNKCLSALWTYANSLCDFASKHKRASPLGPNKIENFRATKLLVEMKEIVRGWPPKNLPDFGVIDFRKWPWQCVMHQLLVIMSHRRDECARAYFEQVLKLLPQAWDEENGGRQSAELEFDVGLEMELLNGAAGYLLSIDSDSACRLLRPIISAKSHSGKIADMVDALVLAEDRRNTGQFWRLWQEFADGFEQTSNFKGVDDSNDIETLVRSLFLNSGWKKETRHWKPLDGQEQRFTKLFLSLPPSRGTLSAFTYFVYKLGIITLPDAFVHISEKVRDNAGNSMLSIRSMGYLEEILAQQVYGGITRLRSDRAIRAATLDVLDLMIEAGSSSAYKMRDDFLTPLAGRFDGENA